MFHIFRVIRRNKIKIVHTHSSKAGILGRWAAALAGVPVIIHTIHGWGVYKYKNKIVKSLFIFLESLTAKITSSLIAVSNSDIEFGLKNKIGNKEKYSLIPYGIDKSRFERKRVDFDVRQELGWDKGIPVIGMIACFKPQKDHRTFIKAAAEVSAKFPRARFILVGDGELRVEIEEIIASLKLNDKVKLLGWRRDIPAVINSLDMLVLSSNWEGLPVSLIEGWAAGKPLIASDVCGVSEVVKDFRNGYLFPRSDAGTLAGKILTLLENHELKDKISGNCLASFPADFEEYVMLDKINKLYSGFFNRKIRNNRVADKFYGEVNVFKVL